MSVLPPMPAAAPLDDLVERVLAALLPRIGADGRQGLVLAVLTGATVGLDEAAAQLRALIVAGYRLRLVFSAMAEHLYGPWLRAQIAGFPQWEMIGPERWYGDLVAARAVVVPMLSVNSLSRLALLIADHQAGNLILHGLFAGKPVVLSEDGVVSGEGRRALGFDAGTPVLKAAIADRLRQVRELGAVVVAGGALAATLNDCLGGVIAAPAAVQPLRSTARVIGRAEVMAAGAGGRLAVAPGAVITPLARDAARERGVSIETTAG